MRDYDPCIRIHIHVRVGFEYVCLGMYVSVFVCAFVCFNCVFKFAFVIFVSNSFQIVRQIQ